MKSLTGGLVALAMAAAITAQAAEQGIAKVVNIKGAARYNTTDNSTWRPLKVGTVLKQGTVIQTASESHVDVVLNNPNASFSQSAALSEMDSASPSTSTVAYSQPKAEQDAIRIYQNTVLGIDKLTVTHTGVDKVTNTELDLKAGKILGTVKKLAGGSDYKIKIPNGVAGIRGTIYSISADGILSVYSGSVVLSYVGSNGTPVTQEVKAGQQYDAKTGEITNIPEDQLKQGIRDARALRGGAGTPPTVFAVDRTVYNVSPTQGGDDLFQ